MSLAEASEWTLQAKCRDMADSLFPEGKDQKRARSVCMGCPVRSECLAEASDNLIEWGVWCGMTVRERRALLRARPDIESGHVVLLNYLDDPAATITVLPRSSAASKNAASPMSFCVPADSSGSRSS